MAPSPVLEEFMVVATVGAIVALYHFVYKPHKERSRRDCSKSHQSPWQGGERKPVRRDNIKPKTTQAGGNDTTGLRRQTTGGRGLEQASTPTPYAPSQMSPTPAGSDASWFSAPTSPGGPPTVTDWAIAPTSPDPVQSPRAAVRSASLASLNVRVEEWYARNGVRSDVGRESDLDKQRVAPPAHIITVQPPEPPTSSIEQVVHDSVAPTTDSLVSPSDADPPAPPTPALPPSNSPPSPAKLLTSVSEVEVGESSPGPSLRDDRGEGSSQASTPMPYASPATSPTSLTPASPESDASCQWFSAQSSAGGTPTGWATAPTSPGQTPIVRVGPSLASLNARVEEWYARNGVGVRSSDGSRGSDMHQDL